MNHDRLFPPASESGSVAGPPYFSRSYELSGKIMLTAIIILFFVVVLMVFLHLYARWYLLRARRRRHHHHHHHHLRRHRNRRSNLVFYVDPDNNHAVASEPPSCGLDAAVLKTLPVFSFAGDAAEAPECAVCLSEFEENEIGRLLPKCNHSFHIACIDMWFHTHSTCPLCRSAVEAAPGSSGEVNIAVGEPDSADPAHSHDRCATCQQGEEQSSGSSTSAAETPSSSGGRSKPVEIQIPIRNESFVRSEDDSPASQNFRSPMSRMLSFTRILSRERRGAMSPSSGCGGGAATTESVV